MKPFQLFVISLLATSLSADSVKDSSKLNFDQRVEIVRGLMAEFATVKTFLPRSKKPLPFESSGKYDKKKWDEIGREFGPAARVRCRLKDGFGFDLSNSERPGHAISLKVVEWALGATDDRNGPSPPQGFI